MRFGAQVDAVVKAVASLPAAPATAPASDLTAKAVQRLTEQAPTRLHSLAHPLTD